MGEKERKQYEQLALMPVTRLIPRLAVPTVISMLITMLPVSAYAMAHDLAGLMEARKISVLCWSAAAMEQIGRAHV